MDLEHLRGAVDDQEFPVGHVTPRRGVCPVELNKVVGEGAALAESRS